MPPEVISKSTNWPYGKTTLIRFKWSECHSVIVKSHDVKLEKYDSNIERMEVVECFFTHGINLIRRDMYLMSTEVSFEVFIMSNELFISQDFSCTRLSAARVSNDCIGQH